MDSEGLNVNCNPGKSRWLGHPGGRQVSKSDGLAVGVVLDGGRRRIHTRLAGGEGEAEIQGTSWCCGAACE